MYSACLSPASHSSKLLNLRGGGHWELLNSWFARKKCGQPGDSPVADVGSGSSLLDWALNCTVGTNSEWLVSELNWTVRQPVDVKELIFVWKKQVKIFTSSVKVYRWRVGGRASQKGGKVWTNDGRWEAAWCFGRTEGGSWNGNTEEGSARWRWRGKQRTLVYI